MTLCRSVDVCRGLCRVCVECVSMLLDRSYVHVVSMCVGVSECRSVGVSECQSVGVCVGASVKGSALVMGPTPIHPSIHKVCHLKGRASSQGYSFSPTFVMCSIRHSNAHKLTFTVNTINTINTVIPFIHKVCHLESRASSHFSSIVYVQLGTPSL